MIPFDRVIETLGLGEPHPAMRAAWSASEALFAGARAGFCHPAPLEASARLLGLPEEFIRDMLAAIPAARADPVLFPYLWHCRRLIGDPAAGWPLLGAGFPVIRPDAAPAAGMGYALVFLDSVAECRQRFRDLGVPEAVCLETLQDFGRWIAEYKKARGAWGLSNLGWMQTHLRARIFSLGRLQFRLEWFGLDFHAWRETGTGRVLLLAGEGMSFQPPGLQAYGEGAAQAPGAWTATYRETADEVAGMPVDPRGAADPVPVRLPRSRWEPVLTKGDPVIGIHIPAGGPMDFAACGESFARALAFFPKFFPSHPITAFTCGSWLLDPQFEGRLPETTNTLRFLREMYLHPLPGGTDYALFERVFDRKRPAADVSLDGMTTLQKAVMGLVREGGAWRAGASLLFPADLAWGARPYRAMWPHGMRTADSGTMF
jgi:hypothetical protein